MNTESRFNLSRIAIQNPSITVYLLVVLLLAGMFAYLELGQDEDPPFSFRVMAVRVFWPGATAMQMTEQVTDKLEQVMQQVPYADKISSYSKPGESTIIFELKDSTPPEQLANSWYQTRKKIQDIQADLPKGVVGPFLNDEFGDVFGIIYSLSADGFTWAELEDYSDEIRKELLRVPNVSKVEMFGKQSRKIYVDISQKKLSQLGIDIGQLMAEIDRQNAVASAGVVRTPLEDIQVRISGQYDNLDDLREMPLRFGNQIVRLGDLGVVTRGYSDPPDPKTRYQQKDVIAIGISMVKGGDIIQLGKDLEGVVANLQKNLPMGIELAQVQDQPEVVADSVNEFLKVLAEAVIIVLLVSFLALGLHFKPWRIDTRPGLVVLLSIPLVLAITFLIMRYWGIDLHKVSLGSLIIALGLMVDDAIIIVEMTVRKLEEGYDKLKASTFAFSATSAPMLTGTLITAAGFIPIGLAQSATGEYAFAIFGVTIAALLVSWLVSVYFVPYLGYHLLKENPNKGAEIHESFDTPFYNRVRGTVNWCVEHRWVTISATLLAFVMGLAGMNVVDKQFFPDSARPEILVDMWLPEGTSFEFTENLVHRVEARLAQDEGIDTITSFVGTGAPRFYLSLDQQFPQNNLAQLIVIPKAFEDRERLREEIPLMLAQEFPEARSRSRLLPNGPPVSYPVQFRVVGSDPQKVRELADKVRAEIAKNPDVVGLNDNWNESVKAMNLTVDQDRARALGVNTQALANAGHSLLSGLPIGTYREDNHQIPIVLRQPVDERNSLTALTEAYMPTASGKSIPISQVATGELGWEPGVVWRMNRQYAITVQGDAREGVEGATLAAIVDKQLNELRKDLESGYKIDVAGTIEQSSKGQDSITVWIPVMLFIMFTLLMLQLRSFSRSLLVFLTGPLGIIGAVLALIILDRPLGFVAFLGIIAMNGMIIRNSVILVDQIEKDVVDGVPLWDAIVESAVRRFRPIMLTAAAAVLAMIPLSSSVFWGPMAVAIMGGLVVATMLTLLSLPAMYAAWFRVKKEA